MTNGLTTRAATEGARRGDRAERNAGGTRLPRLETENMLPNIPIPALTIGLLIGSNLFMTYAWYGHLRHQAMPVLAAIVISWGVAFFEYCLQVPANRIGYGYFSAAELKTIQEVISLTIFGLFSTVYLGESLGWNHLIGFGLIVGGAFFVFRG